jgi:hypothetical protein
MSGTGLAVNFDSISMSIVPDKQYFYTAAPAWKGKKCILSVYLFCMIVAIWVIEKA